MSAPRPKRKNPILATRLAKLPPHARSRVALGLTAAAAIGRFELQTCRDCGRVQYPPREACHGCLSPRLDWRVQDGAGELLAQTVLHHSHDLFFRERLPWRLGLVRLDAGPSVVAHLHGDVLAPPARVRVSARLDRSGQAILVALPCQASPNLTDEPRWHEMSCDPRFRKVLITDSKTALGQALARTLAEAGAEVIWAGRAEPWKKFPGADALDEIAQLSWLPLDLTDARSVKEIAGEIGAKVDIVINNAEVHRPFGIGARSGTETARLEMEVNYFGLLRLAQELAPALRARAGDGQASACAWVNVLSIYALTNFPPHGTYSASKAAAHSLAQCLRAEMRTAGVRVVNVYPGPIDDEWNQMLPPPKLSTKALAAAIVSALRAGSEDLFPGEVAQEWYERWRENPKALEREISSG